MGTGIGHYIPLVAYLGFWVMCVLSLTGRPLLGLLLCDAVHAVSLDADKFLDYPLGTNMMTILVMCVIIGAFCMESGCRSRRFI